MASSVSTLAGGPKQGFFRRGGSSTAGGGARFLGAGRGVTAGSVPGTGRVRRRRPAAGAAGVVGSLMSDCVGSAASAGGAEASSSGVAGDVDIGDALDSGLFMAVGAFVGGEASRAPATSGSVVTAAGAFFLAASGVVGAGSSSAKGRGDVGRRDRRRTLALGPGARWRRSYGARESTRPLFLRDWLPETSRVRVRNSVSFFVRAKLILLYCSR